MNVIVLHSGKEWKVLSMDQDFTLNVFSTKFETKLFCDQNNHRIIENQCEIKCLECRVK